MPKDEDILQLVSTPLPGRTLCPRLCPPPASRLRVTVAPALNRVQIPVRGSEIPPAPAVCRAGARDRFGFQGSGSPAWPSRGVPAFLRCAAGGGAASRTPSSSAGGARKRGKGLLSVPGPILWGFFGGRVPLITLVPGGHLGTGSL